MTVRLVRDVRANGAQCLSDDKPKHRVYLRCK